MVFLIFCLPVLSPFLECKARARKSRNAAQVPRSIRPAVNVKDAVAHLGGLGVATDGIRGRASTRKRGRSLGPSEKDVEMEDYDGEEKKSGKKMVSVDEFIYTEFCKIDSVFMQDLYGESNRFSNYISNYVHCCSSLFKKWSRWLLRHPPNTPN